MILTIQGHSYQYEMENICRLFLPQEKITVSNEEEAEDQIHAITTVFEQANGKTQLKAEIRLEGFHEIAEEIVDGDLADFSKECERRLAVLLYSLFVKLFGFSLKWGAVTGVRPVKLLRRMIEQLGEEGAVRWFREALLVSNEKTELCLKTLTEENKILSLSRPDSFSLYISIPFCPTRCDYCSFVSQTVQRAEKLIPDYVNYLCKELEVTGKIAAQLGLRLETVYMGGGTPTTLSAEQLTQVLNTVEKNFDCSFLREYTVEAGRPDTVTKAKMQALKAAGVTRISINPQTLQNAVLENIGRRHTAEQFYEAFSLARQSGFDNINTDLIAGLPGDDFDGFFNSLNSIVSLSPESITVHTLAMKRASNLVIHHREEYDGGKEAVRMVEYSADCLTKNGYHPYYLYRQSRAVGNMENVGWSKPGKEGYYNVYIMDETHTILACGAGAVTKMKQPNGDYIERIFNFKFPYEYNGRFDEMTRRKGRVTKFYETQFLQTDSQKE